MHGSRYFIRTKVAYRLNERIHSIWTGHRPRAHSAEDLKFILAKIRRSYLVAARKVNDIEAEESKGLVNDGLDHEPRANPFELLDLRHWKPARARAPVKPALRESPLHAVKSPRCCNQRSQQNHQFEQAVRQLRLRMQYLINLPLGPCCLPRPPAVEPQSNLVCTGLRILHNRAAHLWLDANFFQLLRKSACKRRQ